jgi:PEP-CTERM motif-containing protein
VVVLLACISGTSQASIIITAPDISLPYSPADRTLSFEVYIHSTEASPPQIGDDEVKLTLPANIGVKFTTGGKTVTHPYLFGSSIPATSVSNYLAEGTDSADFTPPILADGAGLLLLNYHVAGGTSGHFALTFDTNSLLDPFATALDDQNAAPLTFAIHNGSIDIAGLIRPLFVPEPTSAALLLSAAVCVAGFAWRKSQAAKRPV